MTDPVLRTLHSLRRLMRWQDFFRILARLILSLGGMLVLVGALNRWVWDRTPFDASFAAWAAALTLVAAVAWTFLRPLPLKAVARHIDRLGGTRDRFLTALTFSPSHPAESSMQTLAVRECTVFVEGRDFRPLLPVRVPREVFWVVAPVVALVFLQWDARNALGLKRENAALARAEVAPTVQGLEQLARETAKIAEQTKDEALKKLAEQLKQSASQLQADAKEKDESSKAALRQLTTLEQLIQEMRKTAPSISAEELKELARALEKEEATKQAAAALQSGNMEEAAKALEDASKKADPEKAAQLLKDAIERLAEQKQMSEALKQLQKEMQKDGEGQPSQALQKLAQRLRQMQQGAPSQQAGAKGQPQQQQQQQQNLQNLLSALENLKYGKDGEGNQPKPGDPGKDGNGQVAMESFGQKSPEGGQPLAGAGDTPAGQPGSEHDQGTSETPYGDKNSPWKEKKADVKLSGQLGEGESLSTLHSATAGNDQAARRYKELYDSMAAAAQDAVMQEEIPLGSRLFIKRYFESIRP